MNSEDSDDYSYSFSEDSYDSEVAEGHKEPSDEETSDKQEI